MSTTDEVREASKRFYTGLNRMTNGENNTLEDAWSHNASVTAIAPYWRTGSWLGCRGGR